MASSHQSFIDLLMPGIKRLHVANGLDDNIFFDELKKRKNSFYVLEMSDGKKGMMI